MAERDDEYSDFAVGTKQQNYLIPEEFPEGPFGSPIRKDESVQGKNTPWKEHQRHYSAFNYEFKAMHENLPRQIPGAHLTHDDSNKDKQPPYMSNTGD